MKNRTKLSIAATFVLLFFVSILWATTFSSTFDTNTPLGSDNPAEADDRMREIKAAVQERENVDHYWPLTGTEVSDADAGEHRKVLFHVPITSPGTVAENHGQLFIKDVSAKAELHWIDEDEQEIQLTSVGVVPFSAIGNLTNDVYLTSLDFAGTGTVDLIKAGTNDLATLPDGAEMASNAAPTEEEGIVNKKYVDDAVAAIEAALAYSALTTLDSVGGTLTLNTGTEYRAASDGFLMFTYGSSEEQCDIWIDTASPPTSGAEFETRAFGEDMVTIAIAKDEYFEFVSTTPFTFQRVWWRSVGTLAKPIKQ
jgi:hypothetical protein